MVEIPEYSVLLMGVPRLACIEGKQQLSSQFVRKFLYIYLGATLYYLGSLLSKVPVKLLL